MDTFFENAQRIFDVARTDSSGENSDFTLLVLPDGSLHVIMESTVNPESAAIALGAQTAYQVSHSQGRVSVSGIRGTDRCRLSCGKRHSTVDLLRDQPLYLLGAQSSTIPLRIGSAS